MSFSRCPFELEPEYATRYRVAIEDLAQYRVFRDQRKLSCAMDFAIDECERARQHNWAEREFVTNRREFVQQWPAAAQAAKKVAAALEKESTIGSCAVLSAAKDAGIQLFSPGRKQRLNIAVANFLRSLADQRYRMHKKNVPGGFNIVGPLSLRLDSERRLDWPAPAKVMTLTLAHLFRIIAEADTAPNGANKTRHILDRFVAWDAAASFVQNAEIEGHDGDLVASTRQWFNRNPGSHYYRGWSDT